MTNQQINNALVKQDITQCFVRTEINPVATKWFGDVLRQLGAQ
jgi:hypothetical protein